ncbi:MAG: hypothetical protein LWX56_03775 [Ignavibacteria bacterium]|nr:hypothetical protein [Ignavibacteria bacterium]
MRKLIPLLLLLFFPGCSWFFSKPDLPPQDETEAWLLYRKANNLIEQNQLAVAELHFQDVYRKFCMIDNSLGKFKSLASLAKIASSLEKEEEYQGYIIKLEALTSLDTTLKKEMKLFGVAVKFSKGEFVTVEAETKNYQGALLDEIDISLLVYRVNALIALQRNAEKEIITLRRLSVAMQNQNQGIYSDAALPGFTMYTCALYSLKKGELTECSKFIGQALEADRNSGSSKGLAEDYLLYAELSKKQNTMEKAFAYYQQASDLFGFLGYQHDEQSAFLSGFECFPEKITKFTRIKLENIGKESAFPDIRARISGILGKSNR